jgi:hypothetical protein
MFFQIFIFTYYLPLALSVLFDLNLEFGYKDFDNKKYIFELAVIHSLLISTMIFFSSKIKPLLLRLKIPRRENNFIFLLIASLFLLILFKAKSGTNIIESGGYANSEQEVISAGGLYEYFLILIPLGYIYAGVSRFKRVVLYTLIAILCLKGVIFGGRLDTVQALLMVYILEFDGKIKLIRYTPIALLFIYIFILFGSIRSNFLILTQNTSDILLSPFSNPMGSFFGNQIDVIYSSIRYVGLVKTGIISSLERLYIFVLNIFAIFLPYSVLPNMANLASNNKDVYPSGGGGLVSSYYYTYLSYPGIILFSTYFSFVFRILFKKLSTPFVLYSIMILSTYPRWFSYNPIVIFKLCFYIIPIYYILELIRINIFTSKYIYFWEK